MKSASTTATRANSLTTSFDSNSSYAIQSYVAQNINLSSCCIPYFDIGSLTDGFKSFKQTANLMFNSTSGRLSCSALTTAGINNGIAVIRSGNIGILTSVDPVYALEIGYNGSNNESKIRCANPVSFPHGLRIGGWIGNSTALDAVIQTSMNLHIDSTNPFSIYLNWFNTSGSTYIRNYIAVSDARTKSNILKIEYPSQFEEVFDNMKSIGAYHYKYTDTYTNKLSSQYGWLAQSVDSIYPEYVTKQRDSIPNIMKDVDFSYEEQETGYLFNINFSLDNTKQYKFYAFTSETEFDYLENITAVDKHNWFRQAKYNNEFFYKTENKDKKYIKLVLVGEYVDDRMAISKEKLTQLNWAGTLGLIDKVRDQEDQIKTLTDKIDLMMNHLNITL